MQPAVCGVYLLFHQHELVYVGRSTDCYQRIGGHRTKGRAFDYAIVAACPASDAPWVEEALIASMNAKQNRIGDRVAHGAKVVMLNGDQPPMVVSVEKARQRAVRCGVPNDIFNAALAAGDIPSFLRNPNKPAGRGSARLVPVKALDAFCEAHQGARLAG